MVQTDPEAAKVVFEAGVQNLVMVPLEVTHTALATPAVMQRMMQRQTPFLQLMHKLLMFFAQTYKEVFSFEHPPLHDPLAVFFVACPSAFTVSLHSQALDPILMTLTLVSFVKDSSCLIYGCRVHQ